MPYIGFPEAMIDLGTVWLDDVLPGEGTNLAAAMDLENPSGVDDPYAAIQEAEAKLEELYQDGSPDEASDFKATLDAMRAVFYSSQSVANLMDSTEELLGNFEDGPGPIPVRSEDDPSQEEVEVVWDNYLIDNLWWVEKYVELGIDNAQDYLNEMKKLATQGKMMATSGMVQSVPFALL